MLPSQPSNTVSPGCACGRNDDRILRFRMSADRIDRYRAFAMADEVRDGSDNGRRISCLRSCDSNEQQFQHGPSPSIIVREDERPCADSDNPHD